MFRVRSRTSALGWALALTLCLHASACGGNAPAPVTAEATAGTGKQLTAFDAEGNSVVCELPRTECAERKTNPDFSDRCRLAGFRILRCGCEDVCSGKVEKNEKFYDASGKQRSCEPEQTGCSPAETSARFQDACTDARHKLVVCGCEWLCNGPLAGDSTTSSE
jgi:hypothetical protein